MAIGKGLPGRPMQLRSRSSRPLVPRPAAAVARRVGLAALVSALVALLAPGVGRAEVLSGVCPDGSMFIVRSEASIPCRDAKIVAPDDMPPLKPQNLPRPYGWEVHNRRHDPNNPYNVVESARPVSDAQRRERPAPPAPQTASALRPQTGSAPQAVAPAIRPDDAPATLGLTPREIEQLARIVELSQETVPATFTASPDADPRGVSLRLARSQAFEGRLRESGVGAGDGTSGPVVLFRADASGSATFWGNLTFVQGHVAFHPQRSDPAQLGLLDGRFGRQESGGSVLGYVVLPDYVDLSAPLDVYWNDRRLRATLAPAS